MTSGGEIDDPRRKLLVGMLASGLFVASKPGILINTVQAQILGKIPGPLDSGQSIYELSGKVFVNGQLANIDTFISANDKIETQNNSHVIFVVGKDSFILQSNSSLQLVAEKNTGVSEKLKATSVATMRLLTGKLLSVFGKREHKITTAIATIGIRGTGVYIESDPDESYICTCYGITDLSAISDPANTETIVSTHHSAPRYISASSSSGKLIHPAPFKNHDDEELALIEALVGRSPPFPVPANLRSRSRRY
ncbi:MAG: hypothetical protein HN764_08420 [Gammaproteobacteria bacterium]|jgi:hypothetical protein|nr:hypothetical protein [Gammaproteobacteria bacterium]